MRLPSLKNAFSKPLQIYLNLKKYLDNASWMISEKIIGMGVIFLVTVVVARYLGPEKFGVLSYALSMTAIFASAGHMGLAGLVVREVVRNPEDKYLTLGTAFYLKMAGMVAAFFLVLGSAFLSENAGSTEFWVLILVALAIFFQPFDVIDYWFQSQVKAKYAAIARISAILASSALKLIFVFAGAGLLLFALSGLIQAIVAALILIAFYQKTSGRDLFKWQYKNGKAKYLLSQGWVIYLGSIFAVIYMKIDQVMLKWLVGASEVGTYAVAAQLSEVWYFVPTAIVATFYPRLIELHASNKAKYLESLQRIYDVLFLLAVAVALIVSLIAPYLIKSFFGTDYMAAASILVIHIWGGVFIFMRALFSRWILIEDALMFSLITQASGAVINVLLNLIFIPLYGAVGAAITTVISYAAASYLVLFFYPKTRPVFYMMTKSMVWPFRYVFACSSKSS